MAAPVLGGLLVADEVIDVFLPVLYFAVHKVRWSKLVHSHPHRASTMGQGQVPASLG
jgi:Cu(I)/Ag(I) efflux system membrane protein CusA/SilA